MYLVYIIFIVGFFFQAEDGIRDGHVTGVQTCALPIYGGGGVDPLPVLHRDPVVLPGPLGAEGVLGAPGEAVEMDARVDRGRLCDRGAALHLEAAGAVGVRGRALAVAVGFGERCRGQGHGRHERDDRGRSDRQGSPGGRTSWHGSSSWDITGVCISGHPRHVPPGCPSMTSIMSDVIAGRIELLDPPARGATGSLWRAIGPP